MNTPATPDCSLVFPPDPAWVRAAREAVRSLLAAAHRTELTDTALVLTSEVVTNAVNACQAQHCNAPVRLNAEWTQRQQLHVLVHDKAPGLPMRRGASWPPDAESGRGLTLIAHSADAWGVCESGGDRGKATWFVLGVRPAKARSLVGCTDCKKLETARRRAVAKGEETRIVEATIAVRSHFRHAHLMRGELW
ncbi:anti-sigma regulatory factor (Ser/Thr protein kinase) [Streptomyces olivoverticillatus]|uniref:Anti-sigma regulatory factor (Ser/Thr protein kinase) n=1 Tax=Streptomyces olivoverticillatus TaxID=66427 RepID=A0A7W7LK39_9ACTN|nr:ATP-binding protein [Streptomyces olivoverticillatus]MBB4891713.1 anti-sigma regulatory factor (Ser/Thr protein kinase) [Streptomyces olivoverticillatus]